MVAVDFITPMSEIADKREAQEERSGIPHEDRCRVEVVAQKRHTGADDSSGQSAAASSRFACAASSSRLTAAMAVTPAASPSRPSIRLMTLVNPTM